MIATGELSCHQVYEDEFHLGFLTPFPNTPGCCVVIPKTHWESNVNALPDNVYIGLCLASKKLGNLIASKLPNVGRTATVFEGFGINHAHAKLYPLHGTEMDEWRPIKSQIQTTFKTYPGYVSSNGGPKAPEEELLRMAELIRG